MYSICCVSLDLTVFWRNTATTRHVPKSRRDDQPETHRRTQTHAETVIEWASVQRAAPQPAVAGCSLMGKRLPFSTILNRRFTSQIFCASQRSQTLTSAFCFISGICRKIAPLTFRNAKREIKAARPRRLLRTGRERRNGKGREAPGSQTFRVWHVLCSKPSL